MNTNFVKSLLVIGMGLSLAACSSNDPEPKKEDTKVVEAKKGRKERGKEGRENNGFCGEQKLQQEV